MSEEEILPPRTLSFLAFLCDLCDLCGEKNSELRKYCHTHLCGYFPGIHFEHLQQRSDYSTMQGYHENIDVLVVWDGTVGAAAALGAQRGIPSRDVPLRDIRALLREHDAIVPGDE